MSGTAQGRFTAVVEPGVASALDLWEREGGETASPFQSRAWLAAWYATMGRRDGIEAVPISVRDAMGALSVGLPLVRERAGLARIGFADGGLADYNAPILGPAAPRDVAGARAMWRALAAILPPADVLRFERMPPVLGGRPNPFALLSARPCNARGLAIDVARGFEAWRTARPRRYRMELGRCGRLFESLPGARFEEVAATEATEALDALERLQRLRAGALSVPYLLDDPAARAFHTGLAEGPASLFTLWAEDGIVAALLGLRTNASFVILRIASDPGLARLSPGRLLIVRAMERLIGQGVRTIDLGLGDYDYKRRLGGEPVALVDLVVARSWRGMPEAASERARAALRARPALHTAARRLRDAVPRAG